MIEKFKPQSVGIPRSLGGGLLAVQSSYDRKLATACDVPRCAQSHETACEFPGCTLLMCARHTMLVGKKKMCPSHKRFVESGGGR